jgi:hypothetical protein
LPEPPTFDPALLGECRRRRDAMRVVFEWYKYVAILTSYVASLLPDAPGASEVPRRTYLILTAMLMRCARLMRAVLELAGKHRFGEALPILSRSICETAIKAMWLMRADEDQIKSFVADGLAAELELKTLVERNVTRRGYAQVIEKRMIESIDRALSASGLDPPKIRKIADQLPNLRQMYNAVDGEHGDDLYVAVQKLGAHATHGTWLDLFFHYTRADEASDLSPLNYEQLPPDEDGLRMSALLLTEACEKFFDRVRPPTELIEYVMPKVAAAKAGLLESNRISYGDDFDPAAP